MLVLQRILRFFSFSVNDRIEYLAISVSNRQNLVNASSSQMSPARMRFMIEKSSAERRSESRDPLCRPNHRLDPLYRRNGRRQLSSHPRIARELQRFLSYFHPRDSDRKFHSKSRLFRKT